MGYFFAQQIRYVKKSLPNTKKHKEISFNLLLPKNY